MGLPSSSTVFINGAQTTLPSWYSHLGVGVFTTTLLKVESGCFKTKGLNQHFARLRNNSLEAGLTIPSSDELRKLIQQALSEYNRNQCSLLKLRIAILPHSTVQITLEPFIARFKIEEGIALLPVEMERSAPHIKSCSAISSVIAGEGARSAGADEALLIDRDGIARECAWSNIFWVDYQGALHTTKDRILKGVTRELVLGLANSQKIEVIEADHKLEQIAQMAKEIFITQSTHGIVPVYKIGEMIKLREIPGKNTKMLMQGYAEIGYESV